MIYKRVFISFASFLFLPAFASADCLMGVPAYLCASYDFNLPINIVTPSSSVPAFTVMGGKVGIGTLTPDAMLTVQGGLHITNTGIIFPDGSIQESAAGSAGGGSQWTPNGFNISYSAGNVGIGTNAPDSPLTVAGTIHTTSGGIEFPDGSIQTIAMRNPWAANGNDIYYSPPSSGNVGIGTGTPGQKLSVAGVIETTSGGVKFPDGTTQTTAFVGTGGGTQWQTNANGISYAGNVGLGTTSPSSALAIVNAGTAMGSSGVFYNILQRSPSSLGTLLGYDSTNSTGVLAASSTTPGGLGFWTYSGSFHERLRINANGNIGIGLGTTSSKLSVAGVVESTTGGFKFPDGTIQTTAVSGGIVGELVNAVKTLAVQNAELRARLEQVENDLHRK